MMGFLRLCLRDVVLHISKSSAKEEPEQGKHSNCAAEPAPLPQTRKPVVEVLQEDVIWASHALQLETIAFGADVDAEDSGALFRARGNVDPCRCDPAADEKHET